MQLINIRKNHKFYYSMLLLLMSAILGIFSASDMFVFFMFWELELIPAYFLIGGDFTSEPVAEAKKSAVKFVLFTFAGSMFMLLGILLIQLFVLIFTFALFKQGYHSDELYEYGFANSYDLRVLEMDNNGVGLDRQWTDSNNLLNYISVEKDHRFSYSNIFKHASMDYYNPPLKLFLLHTICSFFPGIFSKWFSFCC